MAEWKKIITSGSNAELNNITASGALSISTSLSHDNSFDALIIDTTTGQIFHTSSLGGTGTGGGIGTEIQLGEGTTGSNNFNSTTTIQDAIDDIDSILGLLAPAKPSNLSAVTLSFFDTTNYSAIDKNGNTVTNVTNDTSPNFEALNFFDGDSGTLTAQLDDNNDENFITLGTIELTTGDESGSTDGVLTIKNDEDPYAGIVGQLGFYKQLDAEIKLTGLNANNVGDYTRHNVLLDHTNTGNSSKEFTIDSDPESSVTNFTSSYNDSINGFHYQSGIKYLGNSNSITSSCKATINVNANFINSLKRIVQITDFPNIFANGNGSASNSWSPNETFNISNSLDVNDSAFNIGDVSLFAKKFRASSTTATSTAETIVIKPLVDSKVEDETNPSDGSFSTFRSGSGKGLYPSFEQGTSDSTKFGQTFNSATSLLSTNNFELQFSNEHFHWPSSNDYSNDFIPIGPDYTSIGGDNTTDFSDRRYAVFNIGNHTTGSVNASEIELNIIGATGFDNSLVQISDGFIFQLMLVDGSTPQTNWLNVNASYKGVGDTTIVNGTGAVTSGIVASSGNLTRVITFGAAEPPPQGDVYVRIGWKVSGGTDSTSTSTRKFKYITKT